MCLPVMHILHNYEDLLMYVQQKPNVLHQHYWCLQPTPKTTFGTHCKVPLNFLLYCKVSYCGTSKTSSQCCTVIEMYFGFLSILFVWFINNLAMSLECGPRVRFCFNLVSFPKLDFFFLINETVRVININIALCLQRRSMSTTAKGF